MAEEKKGITVKIDADLHAEVRQYVEQNGMTMADFVTLALVDELHPKYNQKEEKNMGNMRTLAFQVPEELFQRIKGYLQRNNISQKQFVIGLIETELEREQTEREKIDEAAEPEEAPADDSEAVFEEAEGEYGQQTETADLDGCEDGSEEFDSEYDPEDEETDESADEEEAETEGLTMGGM